MAATSQRLQHTPRDTEMSSSQPLSGYRIVEIGHSVTAPYAGMILADLGADVIKIEHPDGRGYARGWGRRFGMKRRRISRP